MGEAKTRVLFKTNGTIYTSGLIIPSTAYTLSSVEWLTNPDTGNPWTVNEINNLQGGLAAAAVNTVPVSAPRITQFYIDVTYALAVTFIPRVFFF